MAAAIDPRIYAQDDLFTRQVKRINTMLLIVLAALILGPAIASWYLARQLPVVSTVTIDAVELVSESRLCYGEPVTYRYGLHIKGTGVLMRDRVLWRLDPPPQTMVYSASRRFIIVEPIDQQLTESWHIPATFHNPATDLVEPLPSGNYRLIFAVSSPSRSTVVSTGYVDFEIRSDCP